MILFLLIFLVGLCVGSFSNVCIYRLPLDQSVVRPGSHCPHCHTPIRWYQNIPLFSYLALRGRCAACGHPISPLYFLGELSMGLAFLGLSLYWDPARNPEMVVLSCYLFANLWILSWIDLKYQIIPDEISLSMLVLGLLAFSNNPLFFGTLWEKLASSVLGLLAGGGGFFLLAWAGEKVFKKEAMGGGDIKLMAAVGALEGIDGVIGTLLISSITGSLISVALILLHRRKRTDVIPFGPFLALGAMISSQNPHWWIRWVAP